LGVGKNMVAAIRYWLTATKVIDNGSITEFGEFLNQKDIYLEDDASLEHASRFVVETGGQC
jgi:hypothetical protein